MRGREIGEGKKLVQSVDELTLQRRDGLMVLVGWRMGAKVSEARAKEKKG